MTPEGQPVRFGTDGVRGKAGRSPITYEGGVRVGRAALFLAQQLGGKRVLVARDPRPSGPELEDGVSAGVTGEGGHVVMGGVVPTSAVALAVEAGIAQVGVQITASHNPVGDNGFKVFGARGRKLGDAEIARFEAWLAEEVEERTATGRVKDQHRDVLAGWAAAAERLLPDREVLRGVRLAIDLANGAAASCRPWLETAVPAALHLIGAGEGAINERVGSEHPDTVADLVRARGCAAGLAVDGDGDRVVLVDETGTTVSGDALTWLLATRLGVADVVVTELSNGGLEASLPGVRVHRVGVGDRFLREAMDTHGYGLGGEESGHVLFGDLAGGDGLIAGLRALCLLRPGERLSEAVRGFAALPRKATKVRIARRPPLAEVALVQEAVRFSQALLGPGGRVVLRYSGTEPVLRILVEGRATAVDVAAQRIAIAAAEALG